MSEVILCRPATFYLRQISPCPTCGKRRRFAGFDQLWYGPTMTCLSCGDSWCTEGRLPRPFEPGWRKRSIKQAREFWAKGGNRRQWRVWMHEQMEHERVFAARYEQGVAS